MYRLLQVLQSPFSNGHALLLTEGSPDVAYTMFRQLCDILQLELFTINSSSIAQDRLYDLEMFKSELVSCLVKAGIKVSRWMF